MIWNKYILYSILLSIIGNIVVWFQLNGQLKWDFMRNNMLLVCMIGIPVSYIFYKCIYLRIYDNKNLIFPIFWLSFLTFFINKIILYK